MNNERKPEGHVVRIDVLPNGTSLPAKLTDEFRSEIEDSLRWLPKGVTCRIEHLVTPRFWLNKPAGVRRDLGRFLAYWVARGDFALEFVGRIGKTQKRYRRRHRSERDRVPS